uniref:Uncharacterized protein n=1 Tax=Oryza rufipogon TaxID=4529 RepID=A0A0E0NQZ0_ORYRU
MGSNPQLRPAWGFSPTCVAFAARTKGNLAPDPEVSLNCGRRTPRARRRGAGCGSGDQAPSRAHGVLPCGWSSAPGSPPVILPPVPLKEAFKLLKSNGDGGAGHESDDGSMRQERYDEP